MVGLTPMHIYKPILPSSAILKCKHARAVFLTLNTNPINSVFPKLVINERLDCAVNLNYAFDEKRHCGFD